MRVIHSNRGADRPRDEAKDLGRLLTSYIYKDYALKLGQLRMWDIIRIDFPI